MNILLVGRHGQLAQALQQALVDHEVVALGHEALDLADAPLIRDTVRRLQPELIVNAAAYTAVDRAETERAQAFAINAAGPGVLAEEAARLGIALVHYSTDYVFDGCRDGRYDEGDAPNPLNVYGASKLAGEQAIQAVGGAHLILRTSWVYSQHGHNFLLTMQRLLLERDGLSVVCDEIGAPTWARTIALATAHMIHRLRDGTGGPFGLYHLTARGETSWFGFASQIAGDLQQRGHATSRLTPIGSAEYPTLAMRPLNSRLDCSRLVADWGLRLPEWDAALAECLGTPCSLATDRPRPRRCRRSA